MTSIRPQWALLALAFALVAGPLAPAAGAQAVPASQTQLVRGYVPPDELVSFPSSTPMSQFFRLINPTFQRVTGKGVVDPLDRQQPIGVALSGVHFIDAFELVLDRYGLDFSETDRFFIVTEPVVVANTTDNGSANVIDAGGVQAVPAAGALGAGGAAPPATADTREVRIDAVIFELNSNVAKEVGSNWPALFNEASAAGGGGGGGGGSSAGSGDSENDNGPRIFVNTSSFFDALDGFLEASGDRLELSRVLDLFRYFEAEGIGQTVAAPNVTVQSGSAGRIQSGQDVPVNLKDFQGNTVTQFVSTGIIIDVTPTLIVDERDGAPVEFIHLEAKVEKSSAVPTVNGISVNQNNISTQATLLSGEMRAAGGLTTTDVSETRRGVPVLRDIPLLKYLFSYKSKTTIQRELIIVLQARVVDDLRTRQGRPLPSNIIEQERGDYRDRMDTFNDGAGQRTELPDTMEEIEVREPEMPIQRN